MTGRTGGLFPPLRISPPADGHRCCCRPPDRYLPGCLPRRQILGGKPEMRAAALALRGDPRYSGGHPLRHTPAAGGEIQDFRNISRKIIRKAGEGARFRRLSGAGNNRRAARRTSPPITGPTPAAGARHGMAAWPPARPLCFACMPAVVFPDLEKKLMPGEQPVLLRRSVCLYGAEKPVEAAACKIIVHPPSGR